MAVLSEAMIRLDYLTFLRTKLDDYSALLADASEFDLTAPVPSCGDWTLYDLTDHLGRGNVWVATAVHERRGDGFDEQGPAPRDLDALRAWFGRTDDAIISALSADPETEAWTFTKIMPRTVGFWRRRRAQETLMHLWDAQHALGKAKPFETAHAADGIAEVLVDLFAKRMIERGLASEPAYAIRVTAADAGETWTYGPGEPVAEVSGSASDLLLLLWGRFPAGSEAVTWHGDRAAGERMLASPLTP